MGVMTSLDREDIALFSDVSDPYIRCSNSSIDVQLRTRTVLP